MAPIDNIILREAIHAPLVTKGSELTYLELDRNQYLLYDAVKGLLTAQPGNVSGFQSYNPGTTYSVSPQTFVVYNGNIYEYISPINQSGITPGTDPTVWQLSSTGLFSHQRNKDQYVDFGGPFQTSAEDIYNKVNEPPPDPGLPFTVWSNTATYQSNDTVFRNGLIYYSLIDNNTSDPEVGNWGLLITGVNAYGTIWSGSVRSPQERFVYAKFEDVIFKLDYVNVLDFGAVGDGTTDDSGAFQDAIDTGRNVFIPRFVKISGTPAEANYLINTSLTLNDGQLVLGHNSKLITTNPGSLTLADTFNFFICNQDTTIKGISFTGTGKESDFLALWPKQNGVWHQSSNNKIIDCLFYDLAGAGVMGVHPTLTTFGLNMIINPLIYSCTLGIFNYTSSEYQTITGGSIQHCTIGIFEAAANNIVNGVHVDHNAVGIRIINNGGNTDHSSFVGGSLNHNAAAVDVPSGLGIGYVFSGVNIFFGQVNLAETDRLIFSGCAFSTIEFNISATTTTKTITFVAGYMISPTFNLTGTAKVIKAGVAGVAQNYYDISASVTIPVGDAYVIGDGVTDGSWRQRIDGGDLVSEVLASGVWVEKNRILA